MERTFWDQIKEYLFLKKKEKDAPDGVNFKLMHGMNKISIIVFLIAMLVLIYRVFIK